MRPPRALFALPFAALLALWVPAVPASGGDEPMVTDATPDKPTPKAGGKTWPWPASLDAVIAAPASHRVLFENDRVRVLEVVIPARSREPVHTHRWPGVMYMDVPSRFRYYDGKGKLLFESGQIQPAPGRPVTRWFDPEEPHAVENVTDTPFHAIRVELKG